MIYGNQPLKFYFICTTLSTSISTRGSVPPQIPDEANLIYTFHTVWEKKPLIANIMSTNLVSTFGVKVFRYQITF